MKLIVPKPRPERKSARVSLRHWWVLLRAGDLLLIALAAVLCVEFAVYFWQGGAARTVAIRAAGKLVAELELGTTQRFEVSGPLGVTVIETAGGRARIVSDPGPRQYCVRQGWLSQVGAVAICAPNEVSIQLRGQGGGYDSLAY